MQYHEKKIKQMALIIASTIAGVFFIFICVLLIYSPGKLSPYLDSNGNVLAGSIAEKLFITAGGVRQGMFIKSKNIQNPVLLYIHGGPAFPNYFLIDKRGNSKALNELKKYPILDTDTIFTDFYKSPVRDKSMHELGIGTMRNMKSIFTGVFLPVWTCKAYTLKEKIRIWVSKFSYVKKTNLIDELFLMDIPNIVTKLDVPVYFLSGKYDLTVNVGLSKAYIEKLQAPLKGFYTFEHSAHSPLFEEPQRVKDIFASDILKGKVSLADN